MSSAKWRPFCLGLNVLIHIMGIAKRLMQLITKTNFNGNNTDDSLLLANADQAVSLDHVKARILEYRWSVNFKATVAKGFNVVFSY